MAKKAWFRSCFVISTGEGQGKDRKYRRRIFPDSIGQITFNSWLWTGADTRNLIGSESLLQGTECPVLPIPHH